MDIKVKVGQYKYKVKVVEEGDRLFLYFPYNKALITEVKSFEGARWHGFDEDNPRKVWSIKRNSIHNQFQLAYLSGQNVYEKYDKPLLPFIPRRTLYKHQIEGIRHVITRKQCILAHDMGLGKTLDMIETFEYLNISDVVWVGPKSGLVAAQAEFYKWRTKIKPKFYTYDAMKRIEINESFRPEAIVFDESQKLKNPTSQRSIAAQALSDHVRSYGGLVALLSGTPSPNNPLDWWSQCRIAHPGFLKEGSYKAFRDRLGCVKQEESTITGGMFPKLKTWYNDESKCRICGQFESAAEHDSEAVALGMVEEHHKFEKSKNEISLLYERLKGLVHVAMKKDCLDLPEKIYRIVECKPTETILRTAKLIAKTAKNAITALTLTRELSDGFKYAERPEGEEKCPLCFGTRTISIPTQGTPCTKCNATGKIPKIIRVAEQIPCPKEEALADLLDEFEEYGRVIIYAGFTGSVDRCVNICKKNKWNYIRVDGRGWESDIMDYKDPTQLQTAFQEYIDVFPKVAFVAQPESGGISLNLTASPVEIYYSNSFKGEARTQSEDRNYRIGSKGSVVIDLIHLPTDRLVLNNLKQKRELELMSMGELESCLNDVILSQESNC